MSDENVASGANEPKKASIEHQHKMSLWWKAAILLLMVLTLVSGGMFVYMLFQFGKEGVAAAFAQATAVPAALIAIIFQFHELRYQRIELQELSTSNRDQADELKRTADLQQKLVDAQAAATEALGESQRIQATALFVDGWRSKRRDVESIRDAFIQHIEDAKSRAGHSPKKHDPMRDQIREMDGVIDSIDALIKNEGLKHDDKWLERKVELESAAVEGIEKARKARDVMSASI
ncbi:MAG: hypothetical protein H6839_02700 [Planctomycetes bacterium]|nr:hypothetical protein [Planctomycetota bacterium]